MSPAAEITLKQFPPAPEADVPRPLGRTIFCAPAAGSGARGFLAPFARASIRRSLCVAQLPGREDRLDEPCIDDIVEIGTSVARAITDHVDREGIEDLALFGHSFGALVMLEAARELDRQGARPVTVLAVAACAPPSLPLPFDVQGASESEVAEALGDLGGLDFSGPGGQELERIILPTLVADIRACTRYLDIAEATPVRAPILAMNGSLDLAVTAMKMEAWQPYTRSTFRLAEFPGGHFFPLKSELPLRAVMDWPAATTPLSAGDH